MGIIKNYQKLATSRERKIILDLIEAGLAAADPHRLVERAVRYEETFNSVAIQKNIYDLISGRIFVVGGGKAAGAMAEAFERIVGADNIAAGILNCPGGSYRTKKIRIIEASHPFPDKRGVRGVEKMLGLKKKYRIGEKDLVACLLSGGGSALLPAPADGVSLGDKQAVTKLLLESGAVIREINAVRKHLSKIKGGRFGKFFEPARVVSVIISDVVGNDLSAVASGLTVEDRTTFSDARDILEKYDILDKMPAAARRHIEKGINGAADETPKILSNCDNYIIGDVTAAMEAMALKARSLGLKPLIGSAEVTGDTETVAIDKVFELKNNSFRGLNVLIFGGETTPKLPASYGRGGRNQHFAAVSMYALAKHYRGRFAMAAFATDGVDYLPAAAGALIDHESLARAERAGLNVEKHITGFNTASLFEKMRENLIITGQTGTNVGDIVVYLLA